MDGVPAHMDSIIETQPDSLVMLRRCLEIDRACTLAARLCLGSRTQAGLTANSSGVLWSKFQTNSQ